MIPDMLSFFRNWLWAYVVFGLVVMFGYPLYLLSQRPLYRDAPRRIGIAIRFAIVTLAAISVIAIKAIWAVDSINGWLILGVVFVDQLSKWIIDRHIPLQASKNLAVIDARFAITNVFHQLNFATIVLPLALILGCIGLSANPPVARLLALILPANATVLTVINQRTNAAALSLFLGGLFAHGFEMAFLGGWTGWLKVSQLNAVSVADITITAAIFWMIFQASALVAQTGFPWTGPLFAATTFWLVLRLAFFANSLISIRTPEEKEIERTIVALRLRRRQRLAVYVLRSLAVAAIGVGMAGLFLDAEFVLRNCLFFGLWGAAAGFLLPGSPWGGGDRYTLDELAHPVRTRFRSAVACFTAVAVVAFVLTGAFAIYRQVTSDAHRSIRY